MADEKEKQNPCCMASSGGGELVNAESEGQDGSELIDQLVEAMGRHPKVTFGAGVVGGLLLGHWWRKRQKPEGTPEV